MFVAERLDYACALPKRGFLSVHLSAFGNAESRFFVKGGLTMLQIKNLSITHKKDLREIINGFAFTLNQGDKAVIIGEEGNGKSTLLKLIYDERLVSDYAEFSGEIIKNNLVLGYLAQELETEESRKTVYEYLCSLPAFFDQTPKELADIAFLLGLKPAFFYSDQKINTLSGGETVKLQLAKILFLKPDVLLLDEPSNDIDMDTLAWLEQFILESKIPVLFVSHDETLIERTANAVIHIEQIRRKTVSRWTVAKTSYAQYIEERTAKFSHQEQVAKKEQSDYEKQQERFLKIQSKVEHQQNAISRGDPHGGRLLKKKMKAVKSLEHRFSKEYENRTKLPESEEAIMASFSEHAFVPGGKTVLDFSLNELTAEKAVLAKNIRLFVSGNEKICITGKNGAGKTTLLKIIAGELLERTDIQAAYMPQNYDELLCGSLTPVAFLCKTGDKNEITKVRTFLGSVKFTADEMSHATSELSGGQKAKLYFLKMILDENNVLILDEPTRNFSPLSNPVIRDILKAFRGAIISVSHDRKFIREVCTKVYELTKDGLVKK